MDSLYLWTAAPLKLHTAGRLQLAQREAVTTGQAVAFDLGGQAMQVDPQWKRTCFLKSDLYEVKAELDGPGKQSATVRVEVRALALWSLGWRQAAAVAIELMRALVEGPVDAQVSRLDVCADFQGWQPSAEESHRFTCRAKKRARWHDTKDEYDAPEWVDAEAARVAQLAERLQRCAPEERREVLMLLARPTEPPPEADYFEGRLFTGFSWGAGGRTSARLYLKTREIVKSRKTWMRQAWRKAASYREGAPVWRLEFQLRREALREWETHAEGGNADLGAWADVEPAVESLWKKLTRDWLRHGERTSDNRKAASPEWHQLREAARYQQAPVHLHRALLKGAVESVTPALAGYLSTAVAQLGELNDTGATYGQLMAAALAAATEHAKRKADGLEAAVAEKRGLIAARRRSLAARRPKVQGPPANGTRWTQAPHPVTGRPSLVSMSEREVGA